MPKMALRCCYTQCDTDSRRAGPRTSRKMLRNSLLRAYGSSFLVATTLLTLAAAAPYLGAGDYRIGMLATYPPRLFCAIAAGLLFLRHLRHRQTAAAIAAATATALAFMAIGWGGQTLSGAGTARPSEPTSEPPRQSTAKLSREFTLVAFNIHNAVDDIDRFAEFLDREHVDFISLQEVGRYHRKKFATGLPAFSIYHADESMEFEHSKRGAFASVTGIRRGLLGKDEAVGVDTGITRYRTFATRFPVGDTELWIVNVHTTKAFWLRGGIAGVFTSANYKSRWHFQERDDLITWLERHPTDAIIAAGDFNAPHYSSNVTTLKLQSAHSEAGMGPHLSIPSRFPIWGLDHALGNKRIVFTEYRLIDTGYSDHRAQLVRFRLRPPRAS
jgi:endonuclease/exonuclease/phosphatase (EEP) superfamily protein YafD